MSYPIVDATSSILAAVSACLEDTADGVPGTVSIYHGAPPDDCGDSLFVWLDDIRGTTSFPNPLRESYNCAAVKGMIGVNLRLTRNCWPVLKDNARMPFPAVADTNAASIKLLDDAEKIWCCLAEGFADGSIWIGANHGGPEAVLVGVVTRKPMGALAKIEAEMIIELI